ncbi:hypothetical protein H696_04474 [Fonticula alba]|uniref:valine--tRNA ligase n=1 Tax=Fonticula alba TaxID=691883 RepID=A0A058Z482_FONAL|nr:hypothetical protein H696_04474 [Fonticula alba]KCV69055.1 hypothetical protein H696_04474 [Fonticula alba]|eukprot:XP_009496626.1 hypothetical protein H696_04474 [Fonticula alba]
MLQQLRAGARLRPGPLFARPHVHQPSLAARAVGAPLAAWRPLSTGPVRPADAPAAGPTYWSSLPRDTVRPFRPLSARYEPAEVERHWPEWWARRNAQPPGAPAAIDDPRPRFTMLLPPPNVTGALHLGHALTVAVQDALARHRRMSGFRVHWIPGTDHAGLATQAVVERHLSHRLRGELSHRRKQPPAGGGRPAVDPGSGRLVREHLGREAFLAEVHQWRELYGARITGQLARLGASLDWQHEYFTLDPGRSRYVTEAFVRLAGQGEVYRAERLVHWSPRLGTALSDLEVDSVTVPGPTDLPVAGTPRRVGEMYVVDFPLVGSGPESRALPVATTRPETMLADVALAVHPEDPRYRDLIGRRVWHPLFPAGSRQLPVVADAQLVDPARGTGVVKLTPMHDPADWEACRRVGLTGPGPGALPQGEIFQLFDEAGRMALAPVRALPMPTPADGPAHWPAFLAWLDQLEGLDRLDARTRVLDRLRQTGHPVEVTAHAQTLAVCSRTGDLIEPRLVPQWFVRAGRPAARAGALVGDGSHAACDIGLGRPGAEAASVAAAGARGSVAIHPERHRATWRGWTGDESGERIHDWCVSRQIWWGHQVPAWRIRLDVSPTAGAADRAGSPGPGGEPNPAVSGAGPVATVLEAADGPWVVATDEAAARAAAERHLAATGRPGVDFALERDADVLDTWFSSGLLPASAVVPVLAGHPADPGPGEPLLWALPPGPGAAASARQQAPIQVMETGADILFFWVARMLMLCGSLGASEPGHPATGRPFDSILLHGLVRDARGRKMSKSLGNVLDPLWFIRGAELAEPLAGLEEAHALSAAERALAAGDLRRRFPKGLPACGADALRLGLLGLGATSGSDAISLDPAAVTDARAWMAKLWSAARFISMRPLEAADLDALGPGTSVGLYDRWILQRWAGCLAAVTQAQYQPFRLEQAVRALRTFLRGDFCDTYLELVKSAEATDASQPGDQAAGRPAVARSHPALARALLEAYVRALHPFAPFITEELWPHLDTGAGRVLSQAPGLGPEGEHLLADPAGSLPSIGHASFPTLEAPVSGAAFGAGVARAAADAAAAWLGESPVAGAAVTPEAAAVELACRVVSQARALRRHLGLSAGDRGCQFVLRYDASMGPTLEGADLIQGAWATLRDLDTGLLADAMHWGRIGELLLQEACPVPANAVASLPVHLTWSPAADEDAPTEGASAGPVDAALGEPGAGGPPAPLSLHLLLGPGPSLDQALEHVSKQRSRAEAKAQGLRERVARQAGVLAAAAGASPESQATLAAQLATEQASLDSLLAECAELDALHQLLLARRQQ